jgi:hypothetical protein
MARPFKKKDIFFKKDFDLEKKGKKKISTDLSAGQGHFAKTSGNPNLRDFLVG